MPENGHYPVYSFPFKIFLSILIALITSKPRDFQKDAGDLSLRISPKPSLKNINQIPSNGPYLVTLNHYSRPGFMVIWAAIALSTALPQSPIWLMTGAWTDRKAGIDWLRTALTSAIFRRLAEIYGFVTMPPMPPVPEEAAERALSIRRLIGILRKNSNSVLCIAPEGMDFPGGQLGIPHPGTGKMILQMTNSLKRILPVGVYEESGRLVVNFGAPFLLEIPKDTVHLDMDIINQVMRHIAVLLPEEMRGPYH